MELSPNTVFRQSASDTVLAEHVYEGHTLVGHFASAVFASALLTEAIHYYSSVAQGQLLVEDPALKRTSPW